MEQWGFLGGSATKRSVNAGAELSINFMSEKPDSQHQRPWMSHTPGLRPFLTTPLGEIGCRALLNDEARAFAIVGSGFYELAADGTATYRGPVSDPDDSHGPGTITSNGATTGQQLLVTAGGVAYIYALDANTLTALDPTLFADTVTHGLFLDDYFIVRTSDGSFALSALLDGTSWDPLDRAKRSIGSDVTFGFATNHRELWLFGTKTTEVWYDSGNNDFPFEPAQSAFITQGVIGTYSIVPFDNSLMWLGGDGNGIAIVYRADGYTPVRVSTHSIETYLRRATRTQLANARAWTYQEEGHTFYVLDVPGLDKTPVYDVATQEWHFRAHWNPTLLRWERYVGLYHCYAFGKHLVGDRQSGMVYEQTLDHWDYTLVSA